MAKASKDVIRISRDLDVVPGVALFRDMENMFEDMMSGRWLQPFGWQRPLGLAPAPSVDLIEHDDELVVRAALPGYRKDDITVSLSDGSLTIQGETRSEKKEEKQAYYRCEISHGAFSRTIGLPAAVDAAKAKASMKDGVLELTLPKVEKAKRRSIAIS